MQTGKFMLFTLNQYVWHYLKIPFQVHFWCFKCKFLCKIVKSEIVTTQQQQQLECLIFCILHMITMIMATTVQKEQNTHSIRPNSDIITKILQNYDRKHMRGYHPGRGDCTSRRLGYLWRPQTIVQFYCALVPTANVQTDRYQKQGKIRDTNKVIMQKP